MSFRTVTVAWRQELANGSKHSCPVSNSPETKDRMQCNADTTLPDKRECYPVSVQSNPFHYNPLQCVVIMLLILVLEFSVAILGRDHRQSWLRFFVRFLINSSQIAVSNFVTTGPLLNGSW